MPKKPKLISVKVVNWEKYQADKSGKLLNTSQFFRVQRGIMSDVKIMQLNNTEFRLFMVILDLSSDGACVTLESTLRLQAQIYHEACSRVLSKLLELQLIEPLEKREREEKSRENNIKEKAPLKTVPKKEAWSVSDEELERLYGNYPRKMGKTKGLEKLRKLIKSESDLAEFEQALNRFVKLVEQEKREAQFIPHFSTFVNSLWRDYLDEDVGGYRDFQEEKRERDEFLMREVWGIND